MSEVQFLVARSPNGALAHSSDAAEERTDASMIEMWLQIYKGRSPETYRSYEFESRRFLAFLDARSDRSVRSLLRSTTEQDIEAYLLALGRPEQHRTGASDPYVPFVLPNQVLQRYELTTQPFTRELAPRSIGHAVRVLSSLYKFLLKPLVAGEGPYVGHNPTSRLVKMQSRSAVKPQRYFTPRVYLEMVATIDTWLSDAKTEGQRKKAIRARWVVKLIFNQWIRLSEAATLTIGSFYRDQGMWFMNVMGKGRKVRGILVPSEVMQAFEEYRESIGLGRTIKSEYAPLPAILPLQHRRDMADDRFCDSSTIFRLIKAVADDTAARLEAQGTGLPIDDHDKLIKKIRAISPHWFRHSGASESINAGFPLADAADRLGHSSVVTTQQMYFHGENKKTLEMIERIAGNRSVNTIDFGV